MKITEARAEARKRWGIFGFATVSRIHRKDGVWFKSVGKRKYGKRESDDLKIHYGWALTWEEAFAQADKKIAIEQGKG